MLKKTPQMSRLERRVLDLVAGLPRGGRLLELAPGHGALSAALAGLGFRVDALDFHPENFAFPASGVNLLRGNLDDPLPFADSTYDIVVCCEGIEHLEHQYGFARELARVLKPGGALVLTTPNIDNAASRVRFLLTGFYALAARPSSEFSRNRYIEHIYCLTFWQLRHILHTSGLIIERVATDHIRRSSILLAPLYPLSLLATRLALATESEPRQRAANLEIARQMHSIPLFFGRTQIILARRGASTYEAG
jgi:SAM-dependent methyltransferase